jgi:hypothetical protein
VTQFADAPVEVSHIKRSTVSPSVIEGLGGTWRDRPWHMSLRNIIREIERPDSERQWDFFVVIDCTNVQTTVAPTRGRKELVATGRPLTDLALPEWRPRQPVPS